MAIEYVFTLHGVVRSAISTMAFMILDPFF